MDVASVSISDSGGLVDLTGSFTGMTNTVSGEFDADCDVTAGTNGPEVLGQATITVLMKHGRARGKFLLTARGVPARKRFGLFVNGTARGSAHSDARGNVTIKNLHQKDLVAVRSVVVTDVNHNVVFSVKF